MVLVLPFRQRAFARRVLAELEVPHRVSRPPGAAALRDWASVLRPLEQSLWA
jgi:hypothetical protein